VPEEVLDEAYKVLKNANRRTEYYGFLKLYQEAFIDIFPEKERNEILLEHARIQAEEKRNMACAVIMKHHLNWSILYDVGINLLAIARIKETHDERGVARLQKRNAKDPSVGGMLRASICSYFINPVFLREYRAFLKLYPETFLKQGLERPLVALQKGFLKASPDPVDLLLILETEPIAPMVEKWREIMHKHDDWVKYLPPNENNFYTSLGIETPGQPSDDNSDGEQTGFRAELFEKFKALPKTVEVNQAYTVLRNPADKEAYDWMQAHHVEIQRMETLLDRSAEFISKHRKSSKRDPFEELPENMARDPLFKKLYNEFTNNPEFAKFYDDFLAGKPVNFKDPLWRDLFETMFSGTKGFK
jgi:curved DNA-binding protein CbpA